MSDAGILPRILVEGITLRIFVTLYAHCHKIIDRWRFLRESLWPAGVIGSTGHNVCDRRHRLSGRSTPMVPVKSMVLPWRIIRWYSPLPNSSRILSSKPACIPHFARYGLIVLPEAVVRKNSIGTIVLPITRCYTPY